MSNRISEGLQSLKRNNPFRYLWYKTLHPHLRFSDEDISKYTLYKKDDPCFLKYKTNEFAGDINKEFNDWAETVEAEYFIHYDKKCVIEPYYGWILDERRKVIRRSLPPMISDITPFPDYIFYKRKKYVVLEKALTLRYNWFNFWHFFNDTIGQLNLLEMRNFDKSIPVVVPEKALNLKYVQDFFSTAYAKKWNWIFQKKDEYIKLNEVFICKSISNIKDQFLFARKVFQFKPSVDGPKRVFVNRAKARGRNLKNIAELIPILKEYDFEIVDCDGLSVYQANDLFSNADMIMGLHGAGMTNMFLRYPGKCKVLEIFPQGHYPTHYYWLAKELGFQYDAIRGGDNQERSFTLDKEVLCQFLKKHLA